MTLYPAIDLLGGRAVRLHKGERASAKVYNDDPPAQARAFLQQGARALHVVDLDAAFGGPRQLEVLAQLARARGPALLQVGGGLRDLGAAGSALQAGADRVIFGTAVAERPALAGEAVRKLGVAAVACGIDVKEGRVATRGWTEGAGSAPELAARLSAEGVQWLVVTAVARDGTQSGFNLQLLREVAEAAPRARLIASGGAGTVAHLRELACAGIAQLEGAIAGTALYEGAFTIAEALRALEAPAC